MSRVVVLGAGVSGHTAASFARKWLPRQDEVVVVAPKPDYNWIPSNIWVGVGLMAPGAGAVPDGANLRPLRHRLHAGPGGGDPLGGPERSPGPFVVVESTLPGQGGHAGGDSLRLPHQCHRPEAELRRNRRPGPRGPHAVGLHGRPRGGHGQCISTKAVDRMTRGRAAAIPRRHGARGVHLPGRGLRVHRQPRVRAARAWRARSRGHLVDLQRVRARRLRHGRHPPEAWRVHHAQQDLHGVALRGARHPLDHQGARAQGGGRRRALRDAGRSAARRSFSISRCCCRRLRGSASKAFDRRAETSPRRSSSRTAS